MAAADMQEIVDAIIKAYAEKISEYFSDLCKAYSEGEDHEIAHDQFVKQMEIAAETRWAALDLMRGAIHAARDRKAKGDSPTDLAELPKGKDE